MGWDDVRTVPQATLAPMAMTAAILGLQAMMLHQGFVDLTSMLNSCSCLSSVSLAARVVQECNNKRTPAYYEILVFMRDQGPWQ